MEFHHISVLLNECIDNLNIKPDGMSFLRDCKTADNRSFDLH